MAKRKKQNEEQPNPENTNESDDTFGLPEIEYEPIKREEQPQEEETPSSGPSFTIDSSDTETGQESQNTEFTETASEPEEEAQSSYRSPYYEEKPSMAPKILGILAILLVVGGALWYFMYCQPKQKELAEKARQEQLAQQAIANQKKAAEELEQRRLDDERRKADSVANAVPKEGVIETLSERTKRYYVVISSAIDDDLIMDRAKVLSAKGVSSKIIPPFGKVKFYRLAVADGDTYATAQTMADGMKADYGEGAWVVKY